MKAEDLAAALAAVFGPNVSITRSGAEQASVVVALKDAARKSAESRDCATALQHLGAEVAETLAELGIDAKDLSIRGTLAMWASHAAADFDGRVPVVRLGPPL